MLASIGGLLKTSLEFLGLFVVVEHNHLRGHQPLCRLAGGDHIAKRAEAMEQHDIGDTGGLYPGLGC